jgi:YolD-like protein.
MILPEHKEAIQEFRRRREQRSRPELDEQEWERIDAAIAWSLRTRKPIRLKMFDPYEELVVEGVVDRADRLLGKICVDGEWFTFDDVIGVEKPGE